MDTSQIKEHMEVVGSDGGHVGIVDHILGDKIKLTHNDSQAGDKHHFLPTSLIAQVTNFVSLNVSAQEAKAQWEEEQK